MPSDKKKNEVLPLTMWNLSSFLVYKKYKFLRNNWSFQYFHEESCKYGTEIRHFTGIPSPALCQAACPAAPGCAYFLHDLATKDCYLYNSTQRTCSTIVGPRKPLLEECYPTTIVPTSPTPPPVPGALQ